MDIKKIKDLASASVFLILIILIIEVFYSLLIKI
jgi:diacylglycerol kinase